MSAELPGASWLTPSVPVRTESISRSMAISEMQSLVHKFSIQAKAMRFLLSVPSVFSEGERR